MESYKDLIPVILSGILPGGEVNRSAASRVLSGRYLDDAGETRPEYCTVGSRLFRLLRALADLSVNRGLLPSTAFGFLYDSTQAGLDSKTGVLGSLLNRVRTMCGRDNSLKTWLGPSESRPDADKALTLIAMVFVMLFGLPKEDRAAGLERIWDASLQVLGLKELAPLFEAASFEPDWESAESVPLFGPFSRNTWQPPADPALTAVPFAAFCALRALSDPAVLPDCAGCFREQFLSFRAAELDARNDLAGAEAALYRECTRLVPRSVDRIDMPLSEMFVLPVFRSAYGEEDPVWPMSCLTDAEGSVRQLLLASTGLGKSTYLQAAMACILAGEYETDPGEKARWNAFREAMKLPEGLTVLYVPAREFTACYSSKTLRSRTEDPARLFLENRWYPMKGKGCGCTAGYTEEMKALLLGKARAGKLLLVLDSYDEVPAGAMRDSYLAALREFTSVFCVGGYRAHTLLASRQMSDDTMRSLTDAAMLDDGDLLRLMPFNERQQAEMITKWTSRLETDPADIELLSEELRSNHFYTDLASNPYMLSVLIQNIGMDIRSICGKIHQFLERRVSETNRAQNDPVVRAVLKDWRLLLNRLARFSVVDDRPVFSEGELREVLRPILKEYAFREIPAESGSTDIFSQFRLEQKREDDIREILVMQAGLIVPAEGIDDSYQFINETLRFHLASEALSGEIVHSDDTLTWRDRISKMSVTRLFVPLIVPMISAIDANAPLVAALTADLTLHTAASDEEEAALRQAILDILLNRYGSSLAGKADFSGQADYLMRQTQRLLLLRLRTFAASLPASVSDALKNCPACKNHPDLF